MLRLVWRVFLGLGERAILSVRVRVNVRVDNDNDIIAINEH